MENKVEPRVVNLNDDFWLDILANIDTSWELRIHDNTTEHDINSKSHALLGLQSLQSVLSFVIVVYQTYG